MDKLMLLDERNEPTEIDLEEVCFIRPTKKGPEFVTEQGVYRFPQTARQLRLLFGDRGFEMLDRNAIVNMNKAVFYDAKARVVYFDQGDSSGSPLYATVSSSNAWKAGYLIRESAGWTESYGGKRPGAGTLRLLVRRLLPFEGCREAGGRDDAAV